MSERRLVILGSSGSIGRNALEVVRKQRDRLKVVGLAVGSNAEELITQSQEFKPRYVAIADSSRAKGLGEALPGVVVFDGEQGVCRLAQIEEADIVLNAIVGSAGLKPSYCALRSGKLLALANKECLVMGGALLSRLDGTILPVDSEHSALFQILSGRELSEVKAVILTASGGPFYELPVERLKDVTPQDALRHPCWKMGEKVTLDSASLMNKAFEVVEAHWLFGVEAGRIKVFIHPQSVVHALVEFNDGSLIAHLAKPDMRLPIQYALCYPERSNGVVEPLSLCEIGALSFLEPDRGRFPALELGYRVAREGGTLGAVMNAANDVAGKAFLERKIPFTSIPMVVSKVMDAYTNRSADSIEAIIEADRWARKEALKWLNP